MAVVPRPALGVRVAVPGEDLHFEIAEIDFIKRTFSIRPYAQPHVNLWRINMNLDQEYNPVPTRANFEVALGQWDYYYAMSEDYRVYDAGLEQKEALVAMYEKLDDATKFEYQKLIAIVRNPF